MKDSFSFADFVNKESKTLKNMYFCSYDVKSLFTSIPVDEVIKICAEDLYEDTSITPPPFAKSVFIKLMEFATCSVEFSFNDVMYRQINGLGMGSILSSILSNIFVGYLEKLIFSSNSSVKPSVYFRYVDDCFGAFFNASDCERFLDQLNNLHPSLEFTLEMEEHGKLPFLDVLITKKNDAVLTSVYRKKTFNELYQRWESFSPERNKINLIHMLVHRAVKICSKQLLDDELNNIRSILLDNGYPKYVIESGIKNKLLKFSSASEYGPKKCPVYLKLPYLGEAGLKITNSVRKTIKSVFNSVTLRVIFSTRTILPSSQKDVLSTLHKSNVIYLYKCKRCEAAYVGRTCQRLGERISQHVPKAFRKISKPNEPRPNVSSYGLRQRKPVSYVTMNIPSYVDSAVGLHLLENPSCAESYSDDDFSILATPRNSYHLYVLEAL